MAAIHQQFRSNGGSGERPLPAPPASPRWSGLNVGGPSENGDPNSQDQSENAVDPNDILVAPPESA